VEDDKLDVGNIITVTDPEHAFCSYQGEVIWENTDGSLIVSFPPDSNPRAVASATTGEEVATEVAFRTEQLRKDVDWDLTLIAERAFTNGYESIIYPEKRFSPKDRCEVRGCKELAYKREPICFLAVVRQIDACQVHALEYDGKVTTYLPVKVVYRPSEDL